mmetsp:Transcript_21356/g.63836  ORF Transcript_21356/g.63836 Transcript_21356/m.63836 type:complete len:228 (+) Transcript_21356:121-804(+)
MSMDVKAWTAGLSALGCSRPVTAPGAVSALAISAPTTCSAESSVSAMPARLSFAPARSAPRVFRSTWARESTVISRRASRVMRHVHATDVRAAAAPAAAKKKPSASEPSVDARGAERRANASTTPEITDSTNWHHQENQPTRHSASARRFAGSVALAIADAEAIWAAASSMDAPTPPSSELWSATSLGRGAACRGPLTRARGTRSAAAAAASVTSLSIFHGCSGCQR